MSRSHLTSLTFAGALRRSLAESWSRERLLRDILAGVTVGIIAIPLSMALAVAVGVPPQYGLYTAIVAGLLTPLTGGARYSISGPTAAFVVILQPVAAEFGLAGLALASLMAGALLILMALARLGRLIEYIPEPVTLGFTAGIAIVIATLQVKDFFGLPLADLPAEYVGKVEALALALPHLHWPSLVTGAVTLAVLILWKRVPGPITGHLPAVVAGTLVSIALTDAGFAVDTIGSRFEFTLPDGTRGQGIPPLLPQLMLPWQLDPSVLQFDTLRALFPAALSIAMLGAIESLLCAVVIDAMTGERHQANSELLGQGIGNLAAPLFGGFASTAALARSVANLRAGATSPLAAVVHALVVLLAVVLLAPWLSHLPMASMAALLLMVAWSMSEAHRVRHLLRVAPRRDVLVLLTCLSLTVLLDMVVAIGVGVVLASLLFMGEVAAMTRVTDIGDKPKVKAIRTVPPGWTVWKITGPLFFAAAERIFTELAEQLPERGLVLYMDAVPVLDAGGLNALMKFVDHLNGKGIKVVLAELPFQPLRTLAGAGITPRPGLLRFAPSLEEALAILPE